MKKIIKIVTFYDDGTFTESNPSAPYSPMPVIPMNPAPATPGWFGNCPKCGLKLDSVMGYVCNNTPCPTGLGGAWCMSNE